MKNISLKIAALSMGILLWSYVSLNQTFQKEYSLPLRIKQLPSQIALESTLPESLEVSIEGRGWDLLFYTPEESHIDLFLNRTTLGDTTIHFHREFLHTIELPRSLKISAVHGQNSYKIRLEPRIKRNLPLRIEGEFSPATDYLFTKEPIVMPQMVEVTGARKELTKISDVPLVGKKVSNLTQDTTVRFALQRAPLGVDYPMDSVSVLFKVQKTAKRVLSKIPIQLIPLAQQKNYKLSPQRTTLTIVGGEREIALLQPEDFYLFIEFNRFQIEDKDTLSPSLRLPESVKSYQINPSYFRLIKLQPDTLTTDSL